MSRICGVDSARLVESNPSVTNQSTWSAGINGTGDMLPQQLLTVSDS